MPFDNVHLKLTLLQELFLKVTRGSWKLFVYTMLWLDHDNLCTYKFFFNTGVMMYQKCVRSGCGLLPVLTWPCFLRCEVGQEVGCAQVDGTGVGSESRQGAVI